MIPSRCDSFEVIGLNFFVERKKKGLFGRKGVEKKVKAEDENECDRKQWSRWNFLYWMKQKNVFAQGDVVQWCYEIDYTRESEDEKVDEENLEWFVEENWEMYEKILKKTWKNKNVLDSICLVIEC